MFHCSNIYLWRVQVPAVMGLGGRDGQHLANKAQTQRMERCSNTNFMLNRSLPTMNMTVHALGPAEEGLRNVLIESPLHRSSRCCD